MPLDIDTEEAVFEACPHLNWNVVQPQGAHPQDDENDRIQFNGHTVQVTPGAAAHVEYEGKSYQLLQFHFHTPSENRIDGRSSASEMHMVHKAHDGSLMVFAILLDLDHAELEEAPLSHTGTSPLHAVFEALPVLARNIAHREMEEAATHGHEGHAVVEIPLLGFSVANLVEYLVKEGFAANYFFIPGSLTTPPCTEGVQWAVSSKRLSIPSSALTLLMQIEGENSRVLQSHNTRVIHKNFK